MGNGTEGTDEAPLPPSQRGLIDSDELRRRFFCRAARDMANSQRQVIVTEALFEAARAIVAQTPPGRAQSEALTNLEAALMWAIRSIDRLETHKA